MHSIAGLLDLLGYTLAYKPKLFSMRGYQFVATPLIEQTELFNRIGGGKYSALTFFELDLDFFNFNFFELDLDFFELDFFELELDLRLELVLKLN